MKPIKLKDGNITKIFFDYNEDYYENRLCINFCKSRRTTSRFIAIYYGTSRVKISEPIMYEYLFTRNFSRFTLEEFIESAKKFMEKEAVKSFKSLNKRPSFRFSVH